MNYGWGNLKSDFYRITGFNLFNSVTSEEIDVAMDSNEEPDQSAKDVKEAVADALYDQIKKRYASKAVIPEELVAQMKENKNLVDKFYAAYENIWMPEYLEVWVFFQFVCLENA